MRLRKYSLLIATLLLSNILATSANIVVKTSLDSAYLIMGKQTRLHVSVVGSLPDSCNVNVVDTAWSNVEIAGISEPKINDLGNNRKELLQDVIIQSFDSGMYTLPPVYFINGGETIASNRPVLKVLPVAVDSMLTVHDYTDVVDIKRHFLDYFPDWVTDYGLWILLALIVIGGSVFVYFKWLKKGKLPLVPTKKPVPPYQLAMEQLQLLHDEHLCEKGEEKEYYTRLTDILRSYLDARFGINAMEMTSTQIRRCLRENAHTKMSEKYMSRILETADFVKFAKIRPLPEDNAGAYKSALQFVEDTKPMPEPDNNTDNNNPETTKQSKS
ncbi:MAG: cell wall anchor protein [Paramuribaculum sp.]|nr:cell wall anchor protein [Paramuribaculum sp.]